MEEYTKMPSMVIGDSIDDGQLRGGGLVSLERIGKYFPSHYIVIRRSIKTLIHPFLPPRHGCILL